jgi:hypothetical protein
MVLIGLSNYMILESANAMAARDGTDGVCVDDRHAFHRAAAMTV